ncbi:MAG: chorismate synthase [Dehalococcoidia bacterium]|nr:MAG: chorismate synthase [Dehalococcoidia bacterium]
MGQFRFLTAGESHGKGLVAIVEGMVAGLPLAEDYINKDLRRRQQGYGRGARMKIEEDKAEVISGIRYGLTTGSPIALSIANRDWQNWQQQLSVSPIEKESEPVTRPRPGHADLAGVTKYGLNDIRPVMERASARETAARVAVGAVARRFLEELGIAIYSQTLAIGHVGCESFTSHDSEPSRLHRDNRGEESRRAQGRPREESTVDWQKVESSPVRCADAGLEKAMMTAIDEAKARGDTLGGVFEVTAVGVPVGLGSHVSWDRRLDGGIAQAMMSINAVKGVEIGAGFALATVKGSQAHDVIEPAHRVVAGDPASPLPEASTMRLFPWRHATNRAGGIEGGISNGENIVVRAAVKPIATLASPLPSIDLRSGEATEAHCERSDICIVPAAGVIGEAMLAIVLADACLEKLGGDNLKETLAHYRYCLGNIP